MRAIKLISTWNCCNNILVIVKIIYNLKEIAWRTLHEKQHFRNNAELKYHIFVIFRIWRKHHIFRRTKIKENIIFFIISNIFHNKSIKQDNDRKEKKRLAEELLCHADEKYRIGLTTISMFQLVFNCRKL